MGIDKEQVIAYLQRNWFKIGLAALLLFVVFKKDLSFKLNLNTPVRTEEQAPPPQERPVKRERYTELDKEQAAQITEVPATERFDLASAARPRRPLTALERLQQINETQVREYIQRFDRVAQSEQKKFGIPASVTLGNALLNSLAGTAAWSAEGRNNHFLLPCTEDWKGDSKSYDGRCLRQYENAWTSFRDHSFYLTTGPNTVLRELGKEDYEAWAAALQQQGFSKEQDYARQLVSVIKTYKLYELH